MVRSLDVGQQVFFDAFQGIGEFEGLDKLVARRPGGPACTASAREGYTLEVAPSAPATYHVILAVGLSDAPTDETMAGYLDAARAANARIIACPPIDVH